MTSKSEFRLSIFHTLWFWDTREGVTLRRLIYFRVYIITNVGSIGSHANKDG